MAKISRAQGPSYEEEERENLEYVPPVVRRAEVGPMRRDNGEGDTPSDGTNSTRSMSEHQPTVDSETNNPSKPALEMGNPSEPTEETLSDVRSVDGEATGTVSQQSGNSPNVGKSQGEPEPQEKPTPRTRATGRKAAPTKAAKAREDDGKANVRFTDDDF